MSCRFRYIYIPIYTVVHYCFSCIADNVVRLSPRHVSGLVRSYSVPSEVRSIYGPTRLFIVSV